jgi:VWFA-related protein
MRRLIWLAVAGVTAASLTVRAGRQDQSPAFRAGIDLVQVDVSVLDRQRKPVRGLTAADFTVLEDGKPRPIAAFTAVDLPQRTPATPLAPWTREVAPDVATNAIPEEGRMVVILLDRSTPNGFPELTAQNIAKAAVRELGPGDLAAVVHTGGGPPQGFTSNHARLFAAIDGTFPGAQESPGVSETLDLLVSDLFADLGRSPSTGMQGLSIPTDCYCNICSLQAIGHIADALRDVPRRRKSLLFVGRDLQMDSTGALCGPIVQKARDEMLQSVDLASMTVHSLDPGGLETLGIDASSHVQGRNAVGASLARSRGNLVHQGDIAVLPDRTGGRTVKNTNNPTARIPEIFDESDSYYLIGFRPAAADGQRHDIKVKVNRGGVDVRTRRGYVAATAAAAAPAAGVPTAAERSAAGGLLPAHEGVSLFASAAAFAAPNTGAPVLAIALHVLHDGVATGANADVAERVQLATTVFTLDGRPVNGLRQTLDVTPRTDQDGLSYDVLQRLPIQPGHYEVRIGVDNPMRKQTGSVYAYVDVPDYARLAYAMSDVAIFVASARTAMSESLADILLAPPTGRREFARDEHATAFLRFYQMLGAPSPVSVSTRIVDEHDRRRYSQSATIAASEFRATHGADYTAGLPIADLESGSYLLTVEAKAGLLWSARRDVRFTVR